VAARTLFALMSYQPRTAASRLTMPLLVSIAEKEAAASPALTAEMISRAPKAEVRRYPIGHFDAYTGEWLERIVSDQISFSMLTLASAPQRHRRQPGSKPRAGDPIVVSPC
jgi:hypothetical protein